MENAAQAAAQWAINNAAANGYPSPTPTNIQTAATCANNANVNAGCSPSTPPSFFTAISVGAPTFSCGCPSSTTPFVTNAAGTGAAPTWTQSCATGTACSDGSYPGTYVSVTATGTFTPFANYGSFFPASYQPDLHGDGAHPMIKEILRDERGGEIVENTITMWVFLLLIMGIAQAGLIMWGFGGIQHGVEMAARCASVSDAAIAAGVDFSTATYAPCYNTKTQGAANNASTVEAYAANNSWGLGPTSSTFDAAAGACASTANTVTVNNPYVINLMNFLLSVAITPQSCYASAPS